MLVIREFSAELRRRRVFRTAGLYIVAAWAVLRVADLAFESWGFPDTSLRPIWIAALLLFPVALLFGWRYDVAARGVIHTTKAGSDQPVPLEPIDFGIIGTLVILVAGGGWRLRWRWETEHNRNLDGNRDEPRYFALVRLIEDDLARQARDFAELGGTPSL